MSKLLLIDTREKPKAIEGILKTFETEGIPYTRTKLLFGDYADYNRPHPTELYKAGQQTSETCLGRNQTGSPRCPHNPEVL